MKKFLLSIAVVMTALTASAQKVADKSITMLEKISMTSTTNGSQSIVLQNNFVKSMNKADAEQLELIDYGIDWADDEDETEVADCTTAAFVYTGETTEYNGATYNVATVSLGSCDWTAYINEAETEVVIPTNQSYTHATYGEFLMLGVYVDEEAQKLMLDDENPIVYAEGEDAGVLVCTSGIGWYVYMNEGDYAGDCWSRKFYSTMLKPNAVETGELGKSGWSEYTNPVFVDDKGDELNIYNFFGTSVLNVLIEDGEVYIPMLQNVGVTNSNYDQDTYGYFFRLLGVEVTEDGYLHVDEEKEYTMGMFGECVYDEDGKITDIAESQSNLMSVPTSDGYMGIFTSFDADGRGYYMGYLFNINFKLNDGVYKCFQGEDGISDVKVASKNNKFYNTLGQQVSENTKGIVIRNGRKFMNK